MINFVHPTWDSPECLLWIHTQDMPSVAICMFYKVFRKQLGLEYQKGSVQYRLIATSHIEGFFWTAFPYERNCATSRYRWYGANFGSTCIIILTAMAFLLRCAPRVDCSRFYVRLQETSLVFFLYVAYVEYKFHVHVDKCVMKTACDIGHTLS